MTKASNWVEGNMQTTWFFSFCGAGNKSPPKYHSRANYSLLDWWFFSHKDLLYLTETSTIFDKSQKKSVCVNLLSFYWPKSFFLAFVFASNLKDMQKLYLPAQKSGGHWPCPDAPNLQGLPSSIPVDKRMKLTSAEFSQYFQQAFQNISSMCNPPCFYRGPCRCLTCLFSWPIQAWLQGREPQSPPNRTGQI